MVSLYMFFYCLVVSVKKNIFLQSTPQAFYENAVPTVDLANLVSRVVINTLYFENNGPLGWSSYWNGI